MFWRLIDGFKKFCVNNRLITNFQGVVVDDPDYDGENVSELTPLNTSNCYTHNFKNIIKKREKKIICIEGNISSGKSTTVSELKEMYKRNPRVKFLLEPLSIWESIRDKNGDNMITKFYGNIKHYAFAFQMMAYISRLEILREALRDDNIDIIITERSLFTDKNVFAKMLFDDGMLEDVEYEIYNRWFNSFIDDLPEPVIFYIRTDPEVAMQRLIKRNREGEGSVNLDYLKRVHKYHDDWLMNGQESQKGVTIVDGNTDIYSNERPAELLATVIIDELMKGK
jgi:deoxyadenosine/deoxycytidine kinase